MQSSRYAMLAAVLVPILLIVVLIVVLGTSLATVLIVTYLIVVFPAVAVFGRLTTHLDADGVVTAFGWGWPKRRIEFSDITAIRQMKDRWWEGWGIRRVRGGWMFNVAGLDSVELTLTSGQTFRIGTDEPAVLAAALSKATGLQAPQSG